MNKYRVEHKIYCFLREKFCYGKWAVNWLPYVSGEKEGGEIQTCRNYFAIPCTWQQDSQNQMSYK